MPTYDPDPSREHSTNGVEHAQNGSDSTPVRKLVDERWEAPIEPNGQVAHNVRDLAVFLKENKQLRRVLLSDMICMKADGNYVEIHLVNGRVVLRNSMTEILKSLPPGVFLMVNRSEAVNVLLVDSVGTDEVAIGKLSFTLTRRYREDLLRQLHIVAGR